MMPFDRRRVHSSLTAKGFVRTEGDHSFFIYHTLSGKKTIVRTRTSHGTSHKEISDNLAQTMARQCKLRFGDFKLLIECPLSREGYESKLVEQGLVDPPDEEDDNEEGDIERRS